MSKNPIVITMPEFQPSALRYMAPRLNDRGGKSVTVLSTQSNRSLHLTLPLMLTWGVSDYTDEKGESDGKYSISLQFPRAGESNPATDQALAKLKQFENQILDDAVKNSEAWFGRKQSREIVEFSYFPFLKYRKNKDTKEIDYSQPPSMRPKVPCYDGVWKVEVFDPKGTPLFPCDVEGATPMDFINKGSNVACVIQCGGLWVTGKGWGLTWRLVQCVVKPQEMDVVFGRGKCQISLSEEETEAIYKPEVVEAVPDTHVEDSDDEQSVQKLDPPLEAEQKQEAPFAEQTQESDEPVKKKIVKKVVKKSTPA